MKLRDHPLTVYKGLRSWPPTWVRTDDPSKTPNDAETGIIRSVVMADLQARRIALHMEDGECTYLAHLYFDNYDFCLRAYDALKGCVGKTVKDCGNLEID